MSEADLALAPQFDDLAQQHDAATLGMWVFLATEIMFFGGLFGGYAYYRSIYPQAFGIGSRFCEVTLGALNTGVLLTSSLTMALALHSVQAAKRKAAMLCLVLTMLLGCAFLGIKFLEYFHKYKEHLIPGFDFRYTGPFGGQIRLFICFYFGMTGLHALHMTIGIGVMAVMLALVWRNRVTPQHYFAVEVAGLYWHFVDIVWIFLFPMLYLVDLHK